MSYIPEHGDVVWINFDPQIGHEQRGRRPALVLSHFSYNSRTKLAVFCPITNQAKGYPFEIPIPTGLEVNGVILVDQIKNLDWQERNAAFLCKMPSTVLQRVVTRLNTLIKPLSDPSATQNGG
jgi:mRNA interferase MazF